MPSKSMNSKASGSSSHCKANSLSKPKLLMPEHYLVVDSTLPSHVFSNRSLFTTYVPSRQLYQTVFDTDIVIEGVGDIHIRVVVSGKSILFRFCDSWHVPSSHHQFLSCLKVISLGNQIMIAGHSPWMIFSHQKCLVDPNLMKYVPFIQINSFITPKFDLPVISPQPASSTTQPTTQPVFSLQASDVQAWAQSSEEPKPSPSPQSRVQSFEEHRAWASSLSSPRPGLQALACIYQFIYCFFHYFRRQKK